MPLTLIATDLDRLLRLCAQEGASALYLMSHARPMLRAGGDLRVLPHERALTPADIEAILVEFIPADALDGSDTTFAREMHGVGRVRCRALRDHRGPGVIFSMMPVSLVRAARASLAPQALALCDEGDGLVLVAGSRASGKSTLVAALVEHAHQNRRDYVVTIEEQIAMLHESDRALVSQREIDVTRQGEAIRAAVRESADVIVIDELRTADAAGAALDAAARHLVVCSLAITDGASTLEAFLDLCGAGERQAAGQSVARVLRGAITQRLVRQTGEGRVARRELLLNSPVTSAMIAAGRVAELSALVDS